MSFELLIYRTSVSLSKYAIVLTEAVFKFIFKISHYSYNYFFSLIAFCYQDFVVSKCSISGEGAQNHRIHQSFNSIAGN